jgi:anti-sigma regulatory factor (Ser/Thr protein kinase)
MPGTSVMNGWAESRDGSKKKADDVLNDFVSFPAVPASAAAARRIVAAEFADLACPDVTTEAAVLLVSELASNAIRHARTPFTVAIRHDPPVVTIEVADTSTLLPVLREPDVDGGRGLQMVAAVAAKWGVREDPAGKTVYFTLGC